MIMVKGEDGMPENEGQGDDTSNEASVGHTDEMHGEGQQPGTQESAPEIAGVNPMTTPGRRSRLPRFHPEVVLPRALRTKLGRAARYVSLAGLAVVIAAAGTGAWWASARLGVGHAKPVSRFTATAVPFAVAGTTPARDAQDVTDGSKIVVDFSRPVDASKLDGDFFVSPQVDGTFSQGTGDKEAVFTPAVPFSSGTIVKIMIHGEYQSKDGTVLGADYSFGFTMATPSNAVLFQRNDYQDIVGSIASGETAQYTLQVGDGVSAKGKVTVYKSDMASLLNSIVYVDKATSDGYSYATFKDNPVNTAAMQSVQTVDSLKDGATFSVNQSDGVYVLVATDNGGQVGSTWLVVSSLGVMARQDDQQTVLSAAMYGSSQPVDITATFYSLKDSVQQVSQADVNGTGNVSTPLGESGDVIVAQTSDGKQAFVPLSINYTLADIRVQKNLSKSHDIYGLTDRPTYQVGDTVKYAGFVRVDNDGQYTVPAAGTTLKMYTLASYGDHLSDFTATIGAGGTISGEVNVTSKFVPSDGASQNIQIYYAAADQDGAPFDQPIASFTVTKNKPSSDTLHVAFSKSSYIASDTVVATITGKTSAGAPLSGVSATVNIYARQYYEGNESQNQASLGYIGEKLKGSPITVKLNASGQATVPVPVSSLPAGSSQVVTVQANMNDGSGNPVAGGADAVVHEGNGVLVFGSGRSVVSPGSNLVARVYAQTLAGAPLANVLVNYKLQANTYDAATSSTRTTTVASGQVTADASGFATISIEVNASYTSSTTFDLNAWTGDANNNKITADNYYYISNGSSAYSDVELTNIDVSGSPNAVQVGHTMSLTVTAPYDIHALASLERGRIHKYEVVDFHQGDNTYTVQVTSDLAPSFSLVFSYFHDGSPYTEGVTYDVPPVSQQATLSLTSDASSYAANSTANITLAAKDSDGNPLATDVVLGVVDADVYNLNNEATPDMFNFLFGPREITTNSSSSLTGIGSGGGKCGGGGSDQPDLLNPLGTTLLWKPLLSTNASGMLNASVKLPKGTWRVYAYSMSGDSVVGSTAITVVSK